MRLRSLWHFNEFTFFVQDYVLLWGAVVCSFKLSPKYEFDILDGIWLRPPLHLIGYGMPLCMALGLQLAGVQRNQAGFRAVETFVRTAIGLMAGMAVFVMLHAVVSFDLIGRFVLIFSLTYGTAFILGSRLLVWKLAERESRNVLIYGRRQACAVVMEAIAQSQLPIRVVGFTSLVGEEEGDSAGLLSVAGLGLQGYCEKHSVEEVVVEVPDALESQEREALLFCTGQGINVIDFGHFFENNLERVNVSGLKESWFWSYDPSHAHPVYFVTKRAVDIVISLVGMIVFAPLAPFVVFLIKLQDNGPVIYSQMRTGLYNQPFRIFKFRTMQLDAEKDGARWATQADERVTLIGRILRKTRIDEVPQFWNVLKGDMSFIGPRPERPEFVDMIEKEVPFYRYRHLIKPGLSGWAQINYPYGASVEDARQKLSYDFYYMKYATITLDILIFLRTIVAMVRGAR